MVNSLKLSVTFDKLSAIVLSVFLLTFILQPGSVQANSDGDSVNYYLQGLEEKNKGNYEKALQIWEEARENLPEPDFRVAQLYIQVATANSLNDYYDEASRLYNWGLTADKIGKSKESLIEEVEYIRPLVSYKKFKELHKKIDDEDPSVYEDIKAFWKLRDLTPLSDYNERLIEHWERIAYCFEHFSRDNDGELDDRADIYIKYGSPDYKKDGMLSYDSGLVNSLLRERVGESPGTFGSPNTSSIKDIQQFNLETKIRQLHNNPQFEVWIYRDLKDNSNSTIFLFGRDSGSPTYRIKDSVEDFIPRSAFSMSDRNNYINLVNSNFTTNIEGNDRDLETQGQTGGSGFQIPKVTVTPAVILQILYYQQFAALDYYFGTAYNRMLTRYLDITTRIPISLARQFENTNANQFLQLQVNAPDEKSEYERDLNRISVDAYSYRFLDENGDNYLKVFSVSHPSNAILYNHLKKNRVLTNDYWSNFRLESGVLFYDEDKGLISQQKAEQTDLDKIRSTNTLTNYFDVVPDTDAEKIVIANELYNKEDNTDSNEIGEEVPFEASLAGVGKKEIDLPEPLKSDQLELSDMLIGYSTPEGGKNGFVPFTIAHEHQIPAGKDLNLYYEVYNLSKNAGGLAKFTFKYTLKSKKKGLNLFGGKKQELSITLNNETDSSQYKNVLEIDTSDLEEGDYEMNIEITDLKSGEQIFRTERFKIR